MRKNKNAIAGRKKVLVSVKLLGIAGRNQLSGIFRFLEKSSDWDIRIAHTPEELLCEADAADAGVGTDGIIVGTVADAACCERLARTRVPVVAIDLPPELFGKRTEGIAFVRNDDGGIGMGGAKYLLKLGTFRSFAYIPTADSRTWSDRRCLGFTFALSRKKITPAVYDPSKVTLAQWLAALPKPSAVMAAYDMRARDVIEACHDARVKIPEQIVLLGVDDDGLVAPFTTPTLSSIRTNTEEEGYKAAEALDALLNGRNAKNALCRYASIVERESTKPLPPAGHLIRSALSYISTNATRGVTPSDVATAVGVSRRLLDLRFHKMNNETVGEALERVRLEAVKKELLRSDHSITQISADCGFANVGSLRNLFRKRLGVSMRNWRAKKH